jgi:hypothetical protein
MSAPVIVALSIVGAFALLSGVALWKYAATDAIKVIVVLTGFFGAPLGAIGTYYFTRSEITAARAEAATAHNLAVQLKSQLASVSNTASEARTQLVKSVDSKPATYTLGELKGDSDYKNAVMKLDFVGSYDIWNGPKGEMAEKKK